MATHTVTFTTGGRTYTGIRTGYAECDECRQRIYARSRPEPVDERTESDDDKWRWACMLRNQAADDALLYNEQDGPDSWGVGVLNTWGLLACP